MPPRYDAEFLKYIRNASADEKVAILLRDIAEPIAQLREAADTLSKIDATDAASLAEDWRFLVNTLVKAGSHLKKLADLASLNRLQRDDLEARLETKRQRLLEILREVDPEAKISISQHELLKHLRPYDPEEELSTLRPDLLSPIHMLKGATALLCDIDSQDMKTLPEGLSSVLDTLINAGDHILETLEAVTWPIGKSPDSIDGETSV